MQNKIWIFLALFLLTASVSTLSACNTIKGIGEDAKAAGEAISGAAEDSKAY